ncbi:hypothetical protein EVAR_5357_1 [Eumeta japonica]|uniref:Uncharacterized protein n=1 Tax=Eumeta variegata TaxID=151549 RepID=A0A4C1TN70_EUMVA|nr:hypothetical protein EVAR_5357_1 [Eumeta japonica]
MRDATSSDPGELVECGRGTHAAELQRGRESSIFEEANAFFQEDLLENLVGAGLNLKKSPSDLQTNISSLCVGISAKPPVTDVIIGPARGPLGPLGLLGRKHLGLE